MAHFPTFEIKLFWDECAWVARFTTLGGPDCVSQGNTPGQALKRLGHQVEHETVHFGGLSKIPALQQSE